MLVMPARKDLIGQWLVYMNRWRDMIGLKWVEVDWSMVYLHE
jgi:hypothetical protein